MGRIPKKKVTKAKKPAKKKTAEPADPFYGLLLRDMGDSPVFVKKAERMKAMLKSDGVVFDKEY